jgi:hypothetical protein
MSMMTPIRAAFSITSTSRPSRAASTTAYSPAPPAPTTTMS